MKPAEPKSFADRPRHAELPSRPDVETLRALLAVDDEIATRTRAKTPRSAASTESQEPAAALSQRRSALASRLPLEALEIYEDALRRGLRPAAIATRGQVCWGCFHGLSAAVAAALMNEEVFWACPHCERLLFNPDWKARR